MNLKKINEFCANFQIDPESLEFIPGWKREIFMCLSENDWMRIFPQEKDFNSEEEFEQARDEFEGTWFCIGELDYSFNVYY